MKHGDAPGGKDDLVRTMARAAATSGEAVKSARNSLASSRANLFPWNRNLRIRRSFSKPLGPSRTHVRHRPSLGAQGGVGQEKILRKKKKCVRVFVFMCVYVCVYARA